IAGVTGVFFRALAFTVGAALLTSLALALTWTPTLSHFFIRKQHAGRAVESSVSPRVMRVYERVLRGALEHPLLLALGGVVLIAGSYLCFNAIGSDLLPTLDEGGFVLDYFTPAGASLAETNRMVSHIESILAKIPEVETTSRRTGMELGLAAVTEANRGDISVRLKANRARTTEEVMDDVRDKVTKAEPVMDIELVQKLEDEIGDLSNEPEPIAIKLFCEDPDVLRDWATRVGEAIKKIPGVVDVLDGIENTISGPASIFQVDPVASARAGFTPEEIEQDASAILQGEPATTPVVINDRVYTIRVRFPERTRATLDDIRNTLLVSSSGKTATIGSLASFTDLPGQTEIRRDNLQRLVTVTGRLEGVNLGEGIKRVKQTLADLNMPPSIRFEFGGGYQEQQKSFKDLAFVLVLAIVLVFTVLLFEFANFGAPIAVLCSALLSTCGVFGALLATRNTFNLSSFMGLIMVIGIVAKNGILLLDADQKFRAEGLSPEEAMLRAGERRLRPIMMTALATVAGMIPLALAWGAGSQMLQPLAIAVIGGILASMVLSLVVTPAIRYYIGGRER
ncbi:MAG TPA: efflux RND transporter permease subunit, partial [Bryobacteraceae bacterium]|nr:efflux RND transporter permease subunit [Bryobacteraceae bacterium]